MASRKKFLVILGIGLGVLATSYTISNYTQRKLAYQTPTPPLLTIHTLASSTDLLIIDSDSDGLVDWEEGLWKTDPKNPDTDGDGTPDGKEVELDRDPTIKGPNDKLSKPVTSISSDTELTATQKISRDILTAYLKLRQGGMSEEDAKRYSLEAILTNNQVHIVSKEYPSTTFTVVDATESSLNQYAKDLVTIITHYIPQTGPEREIALLQESLQKEDPALIKSMENIAENYQTAVDELLKIRVPQSALVIHTDFVNALSRMAKVVSTLSTIHSDPITGLAAIREYQTASITLGERLQNIGIYLKAQSSQFTGS